MKKLIAVTALIAATALSCVSQTVQAKSSSTSAGSSSAALDLAKSTLSAHGGEKLKAVKSMVMKGSVDLNVMGQSLPGGFSMAISGSRYRFEITTAIQELKQVFDGSQTYSSIQGFSMPPVTSIGFPVLSHVGGAGYVIAALPEAKKKKRGFRITAPDGFYTDFFVDDKTSQIKGYESSYDVRGQNVTTSVEIDQSETVDGILVPKKFAQRFDLGQFTAYVSFNTKQVLINSGIEDAAFAIPN